MVVWLSCYAFVPVVVLMAYDKIKTCFVKCCKKKVPKKINTNINQEEIDKLKEKEPDTSENSNIENNNSKEKKE